MATNLDYDPMPTGLNWGNMSLRSQTRRIFGPCTETPLGRDVTFDDLWQWHRINNGWSGPGYHWLIRLDGTIQECRAERFQGAHASGHNGDSIGIAYVGGVDRDMQPLDTRTEMQTTALMYLTKDIIERYDLDETTAVWGHNEVAAKACPSFDAKTVWATWLARMTDDSEAGDPDPGLPGKPWYEAMAETEARIAELERWRNS
jgi:N-acetylmuramoyl-L-alanine amidase